MNEAGLVWCLLVTDNKQSLTQNVYITHFWKCMDFGANCTPCLGSEHAHLESAHWNRNWAHFLYTLNLEDRRRKWSCLRNICHSVSSTAVILLSCLVFWYYTGLLRSNACRPSIGSHHRIMELEGAYKTTEPILNCEELKRPNVCGKMDFAMQFFTLIQGRQSGLDPCKFP